MTNKGYKIGQLMSLKTDKESTRQWKVISIQDDGSFVLQDVAPDGSLAVEKVEEGGEEQPKLNTVDMQTIIGKYKEVKQLEFLKGYPEIDVAKDSPIDSLEYKCMVIQSMRALLQKHGTPAR